MADERQRGDIVQGIPTDDWNSFVRASKQVAQLLKPGDSPGQSAGVPNLTIELFNKTGAAITAAFPVLKIDTPTVNLENRTNMLYEPITFDGETPDAATDISEIGIVQGPIASNQSGVAIISGYTPCEVNITDVLHTHALPSDGDNTKLASGTTGAKILWKESGTGTKKAVVLLGGGGGGEVNLQFGKTTSIIAAAIDWPLADAGTGTFQPLGDDGLSDGPEQEIKNRYFDEIPENIPGFVLEGIWVGLNFGCNPGPS